MAQRVAHNSIGSRIRHLRQQHEWSLTELANRAQISRSYLAQIELGESVPTSGKVVQIAEALGALPSELFGEEKPTMHIPNTLNEFAEQEGLGSAEIQMLAQIEYRGNKPSTVEEWRAIYSIIRGMLDK